MCEATALYEQARTAARRRSTLRLRGQVARARRRARTRRLDEGEQLLLLAAQRELALRRRWLAPN